MRIDQQRRLQLPRRTGELRQHQHPWIGRVLRGDEFLRHQVHPVAQRRHQPDSREPHIAGHRRPHRSLRQQPQRRPVRLPQIGVQRPRGQVQVLAQLAVTQHLLARHRRHLEQTHAPPQILMLLDQAPVPVEPLQQPLGRVEPIDAEDQLLPRQTFTSETGAQPLRAVRLLHLGRHPRERMRLDLDRKHPEPDPPPIERQRRRRHPHRAGERHRRGRKIRHVVIRLEPHQVSRQQVPHQPGDLRRRAQHIRRGERNMQEKPDRIAHPLGPQRRGQRDQVIVMHPHQVARLDQQRQLPRQPLIHRAIHPRVPPIEPHPLRHRVQQRPQHPVGEVVVVAIMLLAGEVHGRIIHRPRTLDPRLRTRRLGRNRPRPAEPQPAALLHQPIQRHRQSPGLLTGRRQRHAVRHDDEAVHRQFPEAREALSQQTVAKIVHEPHPGRDSWRDNGRNTAPVALG